MFLITVCPFWKVAVMVPWPSLILLTVIEYGVEDTMFRFVTDHVTVLGNFQSSNNEYIVLEYGTLITTNNESFLI